MRSIVHWFAAFSLAVALSGAQAEPECRDDVVDADGYTIRSVRIEGRWAPTLALPIKPGDPFSNAKIQESLRAVQRALRSEERREFELENFGALGVVYITRCLLVTGREVDVVIKARSLRVDLLEVGGNVLPIPRSALATFYDAVPGPILALNPTFGAYQDKEYGFAPTAAIAADLMERTTGGETSRLRLTAAGRKSVENSFYDADAQLSFGKLRLGEPLEHLSVEAGYWGHEEPRGDRTYQRQAAELGLSAKLRTKLGLIQTLLLGARYRFSENDFLASTDASEHTGEFRLIADGRAGGGFLRAGLWADAGFPDRGSSYGRIAGLAAYEKEILLAKNQTIGVEAMVGGGRAWSAPAYAEFFGGNSERSFLYESLESSSLTTFPRGPLIRSFGEGQAGTRSGNRGGSSGYWHVNLNLSLPIPGLSSPLIPDEEVASGISLKQLLKNKASDSVAHYAVELEDQGLSPEEALAKAQAIYGEVRPAIDFVADRANVYAVKPLLLCDVAGEDVSGANHRVQAAVGGGLQLTIVTAKMEAGYMQTIAGGDSGNFFARIVFENIF